MTGRVKGQRKKIKSKESRICFKNEEDCWRCKGRNERKGGLSME